MFLETYNIRGQYKSCNSPNNLKQICKKSGKQVTFYIRNVPYVNEH